MEPPISLTDMPDDVLRRIFGKCDFVSIQCLRKTCHDLRNFIDDTKSEQTITVLEITDFPDRISLVIHGNGNWAPYPRGQRIHLEYHESGQILWFREDGNREKMMDNEDFSDVFARDFATISACKLPILEQFSIDFDEIFGVFGKIENILKSRQVPIQVHTLIMTNVTHQDQILKILPYTCPDSLKHLEITTIKGTYSTMDILKILELEQWKKAEELEMRRVVVKAGIRNFKHFEIAKVFLEEVKMADVMYLKELFLHCSSTTKHLQLFSQRLPDQTALLQTFGQPYENMDNFYIARHKTWFFKRPNDNFNVLVLDYSPTFFVFNVKKIGDVPSGARVIG